MTGLQHPFTRLAAALPTPVDESGNIIISLLIEHANTMLQAGCDSIVPFGTTGEGASFPSVTRRHMVEAMGQGGVNPDRLIACVYGPSAQEAADEITFYNQIGCRGILLVPPFYFPYPSDQGLFDWHRKVIELAGNAMLPTLIYNIPALTQVKLSVPLVTRLREAFPDGIAGVKDSAGDWSDTASLLQTHSDLTILVGHEGQLADAVKRGASGCISGMMNVTPNLVSQLAVGENRGDIDQLLEWVLSGPVIPNIKALLADKTDEPRWRNTVSPLLPNQAKIPQHIRNLLD